MLTWRMRETRSPVSARKIVIPPLGMATSFSMFLLPAFRVPWTRAIGAFLLGAGAFAYPFLLTSHLIRPLLRKRRRRSAGAASSATPGATF